MSTIDKSELSLRFKDNIVICVDSEGWPVIKRDNQSVWADPPFNTETDKEGNTYYVFTQFKRPEYDKGYGG